ncbi:hypothetical protein C8R46DRAFT_1117955 [Mycena filopes]|nr:hypothetical protein C8R46DRAFT_1117955 [Mycena filopes]
MWQEIIAHNAEDIPSLCAMCLVSKTTRSLAIEHLFAKVHFSCTEDMALWHTMVARTPRLLSVVKMVRFYDSGHYDSEYYHSKSTSLDADVVWPEMPIMPNVNIVEWDAVPINISMAVQYHACFPNMRELRFRHVELYIDEAFQLLRASQRLRVLSIQHTDIFDPDSGAGVPAVNPPTRLDLTALEELTLLGSDSRYESLLLEFTEQSRPVRLRSLTFGDQADWELAPQMEKMLQLAGPSLVTLALPFPLPEEDVVNMFARLFFPVLHTLSISFDYDYRAEEVITALTSVPYLTTLILRIDADGPERQRRESLCRLLRTKFPWSNSESMKSVLTRKFPLIQRVVFQFRYPRHSPIHFRRGLRRWLERRLRNRLDETGEDLAEYLEVGWVDEDFNPVVYQADGKPLWNISSFKRYRRSETGVEISDTELASWDEEADRIIGS